MGEARGRREAERERAGDAVKRRMSFISNLLSLFLPLRGVMSSFGTNVYSVFKHMSLYAQRMFTMFFLV